MAPAKALNPVKAYEEKFLLAQQNEEEDVYEDLLDTAEAMSPPGSDLGRKVSLSTEIFSSAESVVDDDPVTDTVLKAVTIAIVDPAPVVPEPAVEAVAEIRSEPPLPPMVLAEASGGMTEKLDVAVHPAVVANEPVKPEEMAPEESKLTEKVEETFTDPGDDYVTLQGPITHGGEIEAPPRPHSEYAEEISPGVPMAVEEDDDYNDIDYIDDEDPEVIFSDGGEEMERPFSADVFERHVRQQDIEEDYAPAPDTKDPSIIAPAVQIISSRLSQIMSKEAAAMKATPSPELAMSPHEVSTHLHIGFFPPYSKIRFFFFSFTSFAAQSASTAGRRSGRLLRESRAGHQANGSEI